MFVLGKIIRFGFFLSLLFLVGDKVSKISDYTIDQLIVFFLLFNLFDIFGQTFFRGIYWFRELIISGGFDFSLIKPISPLFQAMTRKTDILDLPIFIIIILYLGNRASSLPFSTTVSFVFFSILGLFIITAIHISVAAFGIITTEVDHTVMIYRDISSMSRVPVDIYAEPVRSLITFIVPIGMAYTVPAKAFLGILSPEFYILSPLITFIFFLSSIKFWHFALTKYSSASS